MPVIYTIDRLERVVYLTTVGEPSFDEWRDTLLEVFAQPTFETGFNFISDRRRGDVPSPEFAEQTIEFARAHEAEIGRCRWAVVVADPATDEMARKVATVLSMAYVEVGYFYDLTAARRWVFADT